MLKFLPIVFSLYLGCASSAGCYPAYTSGVTYSKGTAISKIVITTTAIGWTQCTVSPTCTTGWTQTGGITTSSTYNFVCLSDTWCSAVGYEPGGTYSDLAWTKDATACTVSSLGENA